MNKFLILITIIGFLMGCETTKTVSVTPADLYGSYILVGFDNTVLNSNDNHKQIKFAEGADNKLKIQGIICNTFIGQASLQRGQLMTDGLASTRMACTSTEDGVMENAFSNMFTNGVDVVLKGSNLTLRNTEHQFIYQKQH